MSVYKQLKQLDDEQGVYFRMALTEIIRIGYDTLENETSEEWENVKKKIETEQKPNSIITPDFQIFIMQLERDIVKIASVQDIVIYISTMYFYFNKDD